MAGIKEDDSYVPSSDGSEEDDDSEDKTLRAVAQAWDFQEGTHNPGEVAPADVARVAAAAAAIAPDVAQPATCCPTCYGHGR